MKLRIAKVSRRPDWPRWAVAVVVAWLGLVSLAAWLSAQRGGEITLCMFKNLTGQPCATCGTTRGVLALLRGRVWEAFAYNPLVFAVLGLALVSLLARLIFARAVKLDLTRTERRIGYGLLVALVAANWAYVIAYVG